MSVCRVQFSLCLHLLINVFMLQVCKARELQLIANQHLILKPEMKLKAEHL